MYWTNLNPHEVPVRDVIAFSNNVEDVIEEHQEMLTNAVAQGVAKVLEKM